jgi:hypothetical protein
VAAATYDRGQGSEGDALSRPDASRNLALRQFVDAYRDAWNHEDIDAILRAYHVPSFTFKDATLHVFPDAKSRREYVAEFVEENRREGPATWEIVTFATTGLGRNSALVTARWVFRRPDDFVVWDFVDSYHLCWFDGRWEILVRTLHD